MTAPRPGPPVALSIAGSDSGGGAGIQADLKTFAALGVHGTSAVTAVTAQNSTEVRRSHPLPAELVVAQAQAVLDDFEVRAVKTGMLAEAGIVDAVADLVEASRLPNLVVDPVLVSSTGARLLEPGAEVRYLERLFPRARVVTPNCAEAAALLGVAVTTRDDQRDAAMALARYGPEVVVVTGGHLGPDDDREALDVAWDGRSFTELRAPWVLTPNLHGTGCSFASAIAAGLARGLPVEAALRVAKGFVHRAITRAATWRLGAGHGPIDHLGLDRPDIARPDIAHPDIAQLDIAQEDRR